MEEDKKLSDYFNDNEIKKISEQIVKKAKLLTEFVFEKRLSIEEITKIENCQIENINEHPVEVDEVNKYVLSKVLISCEVHYVGTHGSNCRCPGKCEIKVKIDKEKGEVFIFNPYCMFI
jgi:hypothetical protein